MPARSGTQKKNHSLFFGGLEVRVGDSGIHTGNIQIQFEWLRPHADAQRMRQFNARFNSPVIIKSASLTHFRPPRPGFT
jgi:hypothetical protein